MSNNNFPYIIHTKNNISSLSLEYIVLDNGPGCGDFSIDITECAEAAGKLGYSTNVRVKDVAHAPYACVVQESNSRTYWNKQHGRTGRNIYKSICKSTSNGTQ